MPPASITSVAGPTRLRTSSVLPTAREPASPYRERLGAGQRVVDGVDPGVDDRQVRLSTLPPGRPPARPRPAGHPRRPRRPARRRGPETPCVYRLPSARPPAARGGRRRIRPAILLPGTALFRRAAPLRGHPCLDPVFSLVTPLPHRRPAARWAPPPISARRGVPPPAARGCRNAGPHPWTPGTDVPYGRLKVQVLSVFFAAVASAISGGGAAAIALDLHGRSRRSEAKPCWWSVVARVQRHADDLLVVPHQDVGGWRTPDAPTPRAGRSGRGGSATATPARLPP